jgi:ankyrin repeat protein
VSYLIKAGASVNKSSTWDHMTPLMRACSQAHMSVAVELMDAGSDVNAYSMGSGQDGLTPLMLAARVGAFEIVTELLARGAEVNARDGWKHDRTSVLKFAKDTGRSDVIDALVKAGAVEEPTSAKNYGIAG